MGDWKYCISSQLKNLLIGQLLVRQGEGNPSYNQQPSVPNMVVAPSFFGNLCFVSAGAVRLDMLMRLMKQNTGQS